MPRRSIVHLASVLLCSYPAHQPTTRSSISGTLRIKILTLSDLLPTRSTASLHPKMSTRSVLKMVSATLAVAGVASAQVGAVLAPALDIFEPSGPGSLLPLQYAGANSPYFPGWWNLRESYGWIPIG
jgi:hypothetical protein